MHTSPNCMYIAKEKRMTFNCGSSSAWEFAYHWSKSRRNLGSADGENIAVGVGGRGWVGVVFSLCAPSSLQFCKLLFVIQCHRLLVVGVVEDKNENF